MAKPGAGVTGEVLFIAHRVPYPPDRGDKIRSWNILKAIAALAPVHVAALCDDERDRAHFDTVAAIAKSAHFETNKRSIPGAVIRALIRGTPASVEAFASPTLARYVAELLETRPIRTIFAFSSQMAQFVPAQIGAIRFVMDFVDVDSVKFEAYPTFANRQEGKRLRAFELAVAERSDLGLFVSDAEAALFRARTGLDEHRIATLENGIDLKHFDPARAYPAVETMGSPLIVFTGQMDYPPNIEAVCDFARGTLPAIRAIHPNACFAIVGRKPTAEVRLLERQPGVLVTGEVADTRDWLAAADIVVAPLKLARGVQNKVLEAMAMGKPVIASSAAAEGIEAEAGRDLLVADGAGSALALLGDPLRARALGHAARARMVERYSWEMRLAGLPVILGLGA